MEENRREESAHKLVAIGRRHMVVSGVEDVDNFDEDIIVAYTTEGMMTIRGADFRINKLSVDEGELEVEGEIDSVEYSDRHKTDKGGFFKKIFK